MELNNIIFLFLLLIIAYFFNKYSFLAFKTTKTKLLADDQFDKAQAFHEKITYRSGGIIIFILLIFVFLYLFFFKNIFLPEYISFCSLLFFLGLVDDLKLNIAPKFRLISMVALLIISVTSNDFYIERTGLEFLNYFLRIDIFALFFVIICFLFIINGANLIDGFNGLLAIHALIIFIVLFFINLLSENQSLAYVLFYVSFLTLIFLKYNFPKAKIFLGDSGAYLLGALIAISIVNTSILNPSISEFFFCILLFYLFFEVFFSFFRKLLIVRKSPLLPDNKHLHMLIYKFLLKRNRKKVISNYMVSVYINTIYFMLLIPALIFMENSIFCRYYFFSLLFIYIYFYKIINKKVK